VTFADRERLSVIARGDREIVMQRRFAAPRRLVFDAWTRPELFARWFGARGWTVPVCEIDLRVGGSYRYVMRGPAGEEMVMSGRYLEIAPPERLVATEQFGGSDEPGWRPEDAAVNAAHFAERDGWTTWTATILYPSKEIRDAVLRSPMERGAGESMDRLAALLADLRDPAT
jgi:uncharacterized protein YndB with AHSA1/START domain